MTNENNVCFEFEFEEFIRIIRIYVYTQVDTDSDSISSREIGTIMMMSGIDDCGRRG